MTQLYEDICAQSMEGTVGQYYKVMNIDKKQFINPHKLGDGLKLMEFGMSSHGTMTALALLLSDGNGRGGGDCRSNEEIIGSWAGDRIVIGGDYADPDKFGYDGVLYDKCHDREDENGTPIAPAEFEDVSEKCLSAMNDDYYLGKDLKERRASTWEDSPFAKAFDKATNK
jgi:hypothetical protein